MALKTSMSRVMNVFKLRVVEMRCIVNTVNAGFSSIPKNPLDELHTASQQSEKGSIYDKKPFKMICEAGKKYSWCVCGKSKNQPLCDGTHKNVFLKMKFRPVRFEVPETKAYYLCNCKQTNNRPFCDGAHKQESVQGASNKAA